MSTTQYPHQSPLADKFSGDWRDYIEVSDDYKDKETQAIIAELDHSSLNDPVFQQKLCNSQKLYATHNLNGTAKENSKVVIQPPTKEEIKIGDTAYAIPNKRIIGLLAKGEASDDYKGIGIKREKFSLMRTIGHELEHLGDPELIRNDYNETKTYKNNFTKEMRKLLEKDPTRYMGDYPNSEDLAQMDNYRQQAADKANNTVYKQGVQVFEEYTVQNNDLSMQHFGEAPRRTYDNGSNNATFIQSMKAELISIFIKPELRTNTNINYDTSIASTTLHDPERDRLEHVLNTHIEEQITKLEKEQASHIIAHNQWLENMESRNIKTPPPIPPEAKQGKQIVVGINDELPTVLQGKEYQIKEISNMLEKAASTKINAEELPKKLGQDLQR